MKKKTTRVTLDLSADFYERLEKLAELVGAESKARLFRDALQLYEYVAESAAEGKDIMAIDSEGNTERLVVFLSGATPRRRLAAVR